MKNKKLSAAVVKNILRHVVSREVVVVGFPTILNNGVTGTVNAKCFYFDERTVRTVLLNLLQAFGQLENLQDRVHSGGIVNRQEASNISGGVELIIEYKK